MQSTTKAAARGEWGYSGAPRAQREKWAGSRPPEQPGYELYARLNHNRFGDAYVWVYRRLRRKPQ